MANKGYTTTDLIGQYMGITLTSSQITVATTIIGEVESYIDRRVRRDGGWLQPPIIAEQYDLNNTGIRIFLRARPVATVESIVVRTYQVGDTGQTLLAGTDYELVDPKRGLVILAASYDSEAAYSGYDDYGGSAIYSDAGALLRSGLTYGSFAEISYTPGTMLPLEIQQAATQLAAHWLEYQLHPERYGLTDIKTSDQMVRIDGGMAGTRDIPKEVADVLVANRRLLL